MNDQITPIGDETTSNVPKEGSMKKGFGVLGGTLAIVAIACSSQPSVEVESGKDAITTCKPLPKDPPHKLPTPVSLTVPTVDAFVSFVMEADDSQKSFVKATIDAARGNAQIRAELLKRLPATFDQQLSRSSETRTILELLKDLNAQDPAVTDAVTKFIGTASCFDQQSASASDGASDQAHGTTVFVSPHALRMAAVYALASVRTTAAYKAVRTIAASSTCQPVRRSAIDAYMFYNADSATAAADLSKVVQASERRLVGLPRFYKGMNVDAFDTAAGAFYRSYPEEVAPVPQLGTPHVGQKCGPLNSPPAAAALAPKGIYPIPGSKCGASDPSTSDLKTTGLWSSDCWNFSNAIKDSWRADSLWNTEGGANDRCNDLRPVAKFTNAAYLLLFGQREPLPLTDSPWHFPTEWKEESLAGGNKYHSDFDISANTTTGVAAAVFKYRAIGANDVEMYCSSFNGTNDPSADPATYGPSNPSSRAQTIAHEAWHGWQSEHGFDGSHPSNCAAGRGGTAACDYYYWHKVTDHRPLDTYEIYISTGNYFHSPYQIGAEESCDLAEYSNPWIPQIVRQEAASSANFRLMANFVNTPSWVCSIPTPWWFR